MDDNLTSSRVVIMARWGTDISRCVKLYENKYIIKKEYNDNQTEIKNLKSLASTNFVPELYFSDSYFIVMEYLNSYVSAGKFYYHRSLPHDLIKEITCIILHLQHHYSFVHYDLHCFNIMIKNKNAKEKEERKYDVFGDVITINSEYDIKLIDLEFSYNKLLNYENDIGCTLSMVDQGITLNVFDDFYDMALFICSASDTHVSHKIRTILRENNFHYDNDDKDQGREFTGHLKMLEESKLCLNSENMICLSLNNKDTTKSIEEIIEEYDKLTNPSERITTKYQRLLGSALTKEKLERINKRPHSVKDIYNEIISLDR